jgi:alpha-beta hydrolase superfamily lysophospholipase
MGTSSVDLQERTMPFRATETSFRTLDGLRLAGTLVEPKDQLVGAVVLVHGGGVTREEGGFFIRLANGLGEVGLASLRFDLRGHGQSDGKQEDLTLSAILNMEFPRFCGHRVNQLAVSVLQTRRGCGTQGPNAVAAGCTRSR